MVLISGFCNMNFLVTLVLHRVTPSNKLVSTDSYTYTVGRLNTETKLNKLNLTNKTIMMLAKA